MADILADLNPAQREAVAAPAGPVLVVAGAGTGKTRVLTTRIAWLLQECDLHPAELVAFTFTNRAARQMRERVDRLVGEGRAPFWIGTFHATGLKILRRDGEKLGIARDFTIYDSDDSLRVVKRVSGKLGLDTKQITPSLTRSLISRWKNDDHSPADAARDAYGYVEEQAAKLFAAYEEELRSCNALDFDDLILRTVHLLEQHDDVRVKYADRFRHVLVDEMQDTNQLQLVLIKALSSAHGNVFAVGDDDQSIYSWRGACIANMLRFEEYFPGARVLRLEQNYRSSGHILAAANTVIAHNRQRKGKNLWTSSGDGDLVRVQFAADAEEEAAQVVDIVRVEQARGMTRGDVTLLYRTNAQSRLLEDALRRATVPYLIVGSVHFYERREVRDLLGYLKLVANPRDRVSALRVINVPRRKIGAATVARLVACADEEDLTLGEAAARPDLLEPLLAPAACRRVRAFFDQVAAWRAAEPETSVQALLGRIVAEVDYEAFLEKDDSDTASDRQENVAELINAAYSFDEASSGGRLAQFLEQVALLSDQDGLREGEGAVRLMTIHTAKGLEFPVVVVTGCEEGLLPHASSLDEADKLEEERRLFYVALTRAGRRVYLLHGGRRRVSGVYEYSLASRFLREIPEEHMQGLELPERLQTLRGRHPSRGVRTWTGSPTTAAAAGALSWQAEVSQDEIRFYAGQAVIHGRFGSGVVARVEGSGDDLMVTVEFAEAGRKQVLPKYAPLRPVD